MNSLQRSSVITSNWSSVITSNWNSEIMSTWSSEITSTKTSSSYKRGSFTLWNEIYFSPNWNKKEVRLSLTVILILHIFRIFMLILYFFKSINFELLILHLNEENCFFNFEKDVKELTLITEIS